VEEPEPVSADRLRTIENVSPLPGGRLALVWSDGTRAELTLPADFRAAIGDDMNFNAVQVGEWGQAVTWTNGAEIGADSLWLDTLAATGHEDAREFLMWRLANGLSLSAAAEALGLSRRTIAYYSNGERRVPKAILLACLGWDTAHGKRRAA